MLCFIIRDSLPAESFSNISPCCDFSTKYLWIEGSLTAISSGIWINDPKVFASLNSSINSDMSSLVISGLSVTLNAIWPLKSGNNWSFPVNRTIFSFVRVFDSLSAIKRLVSCNTITLSLRSSLFNIPRSSSLAFIKTAKQASCAARSQISNPYRFFPIINCGISFVRYPLSR